MAEESRGLARPIAAALALVGLAISAALLVDSLGPAPAFCAAEGCGAVRDTAWARPLGIPMPVLGVAFFAVALALVGAGPRAARARLVVGVIGGAGGVGLLAIQALVIGAWCRLCVGADLTAIASAVLLLHEWHRSRTRRSTPWPRASARWIAAVGPIAVAAVALPFTRIHPAGGGTLPPVSASSSAGLPLPIAREQVRGQVAVVEFVDFECPHCRALHGRLRDALERADLDAPVRVVRRMVPIPQHPGAMPAAIAWCCADAQGRGDDMAEALIAAPIAELSPEGCEKIAATLGLDLARYRADAASAAVRARLEADLDAARATRVRALPTVYIGSQVFEGAAASTDELVAALRRAAGAA